MSAPTPRTIYRSDRRNNAAPAGEDQSHRECGTARFGWKPIRVTARGEAPEVIIAVRNDGPAIPDELVGRIFQPMQRSPSNPGNRRHLGLGLYIVDRIVAAHGGRIDVASSEGHGTTFTVRLPRHVSS